MECSKPGLHALLLPYPAQGHVNPMMQLGKRLAALGVRVTLATMDHFHAKIMRAQQAQLPHEPITTHHFQFVGMPDGLPPDCDDRSPECWRVINETLEEAALEMVHTLASQGLPVTCIVGDFFLRWTSSLAQRTSIPEFIFWPQCASIFSIYSHVDALISSGYDPFEANVRAMAPRATSVELVSCIPGLPLQIHPADLPFESPFGKASLEWLKELLTHRFSHIAEAQGLIANSFEALEPEVFKALIQQHQPHKPSLVHLVGPLVPVSFSEKEGNAKESHRFSRDLVCGASLWEEEVEECKQWLDKQPPCSVVFVAFGSLTRASIEQVHELALGLAASEWRFLWVIRKDAFKSSESEESFTSAKVDLEEALPHGFLEENKHMGKVVSWAPQAYVLSHPAVGGFFSHCGWNSTLESICAAVPILGWPWLMDQVTNCWLVSHVWKVGLSLERDAHNQATRAGVERGVRQLMEGPHIQDMRSRAIKLRDLARDVVLNTNQLLSFVDDICLASSRPSRSDVATELVLNPVKQCGFLHENPVSGKSICKKGLG